MRNRVKDMCVVFRVTPTGNARERNRPPRFSLKILAKTPKYRKQERKETALEEEEKRESGLQGIERILRQLEHLWRKHLRGYFGTLRVAIASRGSQETGLDDGSGSVLNT